MLLKEYNEVLEEGLKYFKNSKRIEKIVEKIGKKINLITSPEEKQEIAKVMIALQEIAEEFKLLETEKLNRKNKYQTMKQYYILEEKYSDIIKMINKETVLNIIKKIAGASLFATLLFVGYNFFMESGASANVLKNVAIGEKNAGEIALDTAKKLTSETGRQRMKVGGELQRGVASAISKTAGKLGEKGQEAATQAELYLQGEKAVSGVLSGTTAVSAGLIFKLFTKIFGGTGKKALYTKTKMTLEKLGKL